MNKKLNVVFVPFNSSSQSFKPKIIEQKSNWQKDWEMAQEEREEKLAQLAKEKKNEK